MHAQRVAWLWHGFGLRLGVLQENPMYIARQERERVARGEVAKDKGGKKKK